MTATGDKRSANPCWPTSITRIEPDRIEIAGTPIGELIGRTTIPEAVHLLIRGAFPEPHKIEEISWAFFQGSTLPLPAVRALPGEEVSRILARRLLADKALSKRRTEQRTGGECGITAFCLGRIFRSIGSILGTLHAWKDADPEEPFSHHLYRIFSGKSRVREPEAGLLEAMTVACIDHGLTPPSTQVCRIAASVRSPYEVALTQGIACISAIHGGASARAAEFFLPFQRQRGKAPLNPSLLLEAMTQELLNCGKRVPGLGHRFHATDPRWEALHREADRAGIAATCVQALTLAPAALARIAGPHLPVNVDGAIGAIIADMGLRPAAATLTFILGRVAGLSAHYFEEVGSFPPMRRINFEKAVYRGG